MSGLVVDTSSWISYLAGGGSGRIEEALEDGRVHLPPVVAAELMSSRLTARERRDLERLLSALAPCAGGLDHWFRVGALRAALSARGLRVSTPDAHVAQCALDLDAELLTEDGIFERIAEVAPLRVAAE
ncbi:MAG: PIN domain-containing protein [Planctomycetes bacterium]|nr:PIN domain-containing protein [Planctomycetota bacterium]